MPRRATLMAAAGVILVGLAGAMLFRREPAAPGPAVDDTAGEVLVRRRASTGQGDVPTSAQMIRPVEAQTSAPPAVGSPPKASAGVAQDGPANSHLVASPYNPFATRFSQPPSSPASFTPPPAAPPAAQTPPPFVPATPPPPERTHIVVDGDTLTDLAELYLGSGRRYPEIFEANRGVLQHPDLLPIGARLKIPGGDTAVAQSTADAQDMAPIPRNAWRRGRGKQP